MRRQRRRRTRRTTDRDRKAFRKRWRTFARRPLASGSTPARCFGSTLKVSCAEQVGLAVDGFAPRRRPARIVELIAHAGSTDPAHGRLALLDCQEAAIRAAAALAGVHGAPRI